MMKKLILWAVFVLYVRLNAQYFMIKSDQSAPLISVFTLTGEEILKIRESTNLSRYFKQLPRSKYVIRVKRKKRKTDYILEHP
ncbi:hypothetical protein N9L20_04590 [Flavobacteriaceae bacterium]|nr:hypothetical protein [Flavobacteriaceae bacterium]